MSTNRKEKIGLLVEGGGMKCAYSAGVLDVFLDAKVSFDYAIGVSAGAANTASFLAGQPDRNLRFYTDHTREPQYFGMKNYIHGGNLFNLPYIYGTLTNSDGGDPLNYEKLQANRTEFVIVATDARTGKPAYFHKEDIPKDDYRLIMASCALPAACRPIEWKGRLYYDGGVSDSIPVQHALDDGCDKIVAIMSKPHTYQKKPEGHRAAYTALCREYPATIQALNHRHEQYMASQHLLYELERRGRALVFTPEEDFGIGVTGMNIDANFQIYNLGLQNARSRLVELGSFMGKDFIYRDTDD